MSDIYLKFAPIDLAKHSDSALRFRADSFRVSFGADENVYQAHSASPAAVHADGRGRERYMGWLEERMRTFPGSCVHVWHGATIVGQVETGRFRGDPSIGYVNLFYLVPEYRGRGLGTQLDQHASQFLRNGGYERARLSVSATNTQAMAFYLKNEWKDLGLREDRRDSHYMEKVIAGVTGAASVDVTGVRKATL